MNLYKRSKFTFLTNKNNSYSVYVSETVESNHKLDNGVFLQDINNYLPIPTIYFSETDRGLNPDFNKLSGKNEFMEVMGKVCFIIESFIENDITHKIFSIGEVDKSKFKFYNNWLSKLSIQKMLIGETDNYYDDNGNKILAYYLIK